MKKNHQEIIGKLDDIQGNSIRYEVIEELEE